jgi:hypothetical protein
MRKIQGMKLRILFGLMAVAALVLVTPPIQVWAQDADNDGFTDAQEKPPGIYLWGDGSPFPSCVGTGLPRDSCLDPASKDLFVIVVPAASTLIPANPLEFVSRDQTSGGLGIATHEIAQGQAGPDREIAGTQKAVRISESLDTSNDIILGISQYGTPNGPDLATVYTQRIKNHIMSVCGSSFGTSKCADNTGVSSQDLIDKYIKHTIAHEAAHMLTLTTTYNDRLGGHHYKTGTNVILDQSVYYKGTTFYIGTTFTSADKSGAALK